ncbi:aldo/keto reductase, partial [Methanocalculus natronophilus]|uniref:aldo/keto reductase n=1 Tax=Methanocalculus natronophilus TaxID=1262400 RepID=UPI0031B602B8
MKKNNRVNDLNLSRLGFGAWPLGNTSKGKTMSVDEGIKLVHTAYEEGINVFDTAPNYAYGRSETILGKALKGIR